MGYKDIKEFSLPIITSIVEMRLADKYTTLPDLQFFRDLSNHMVIRLEQRVVGQSLDSLTRSVPVTAKDKMLDGLYEWLLERPTLWKLTKGLRAMFPVSYRVEKYDINAVYPKLALPEEAYILGVFTHANCGFKQEEN